MNDTIAAISTTTGIGAISIIRLSGPESLKIASKVFTKDLTKVETHTIHYGYIKNNNNKILNLEKEIKIIASDFNETKNTVSNLIDNFTEVENNIKDLNKCLIKEVSEIKLENYKIINEFQGILESKVALLKSDLVLEARNNNESLNLELNSLDSKLKNLEGKLSIAEDKLNNFDSKLNDLDNKINIRIDDITSKIEKNNTNSDVRYNKISTEFEELNYMNNKIKNEITEKLIKSEKKNTVLMVISIILILINIGVLFLK